MNVFNSLSFFFNRGETKFIGLFVDRAKREIDHMVSPLIGENDDAVRLPKVLSLSGRNGM